MAEIIKTLADIPNPYRTRILEIGMENPERWIAMKLNIIGGRSVIDLVNEGDDKSLHMLINRMRADYS